MVLFLSVNRLQLHNFCCVSASINIYFAVYFHEEKKNKKFQENGAHHVGFLFLCVSYLHRLLDVQLLFCFFFFFSLFTFCCHRAKTEHDMQNSTHGIQNTLYTKIYLWIHSELVIFSLFQVFNRMMITFNVNNTKFSHNILLVKYQFTVVFVFSCFVGSIDDNETESQFGKATAMFVHFTHVYSTNHLQATYEILNQSNHWTDEMLQC